MLIKMLCFLSFTKMGIKTLFSDAADFSNLFNESPISTRISRLQHKTLIDVNEIGCEAAGASCKYSI